MRGRRHKVVTGSLSPVSTSFPLKYTRHSSSSKETLHPASQNLRVDIKDECASPGTTWHSVIVVGNQGMSKLPVWVDLIIFPSGSLIAIGNCAIFLLTIGAPSTIKCPVAPESEIAHSIARRMFVVFSMLFAFGWLMLLACSICCHA